MQTLRVARVQAIAATHPRRTRSQRSRPPGSAQHAPLCQTPDHLVPPRTRLALATWFRIAGSDSRKGDRTSDTIRHLARILSSRGLDPKTNPTSLWRTNQMIRKAAFVLLLVAAVASA